MKLVTKGLHFCYRRESPAVLTGIDLEIEPGSYWCVAGPNGSGKSTLLKLASGLIGPATMASGLSGALSWDNRPIHEWLHGGHRLELARNIAFVPGALTTSFPVTVMEFVLQGRYAWSEYWNRPSHDDQAITDEAIERVGISSFRQRLITELSGGETQLAMIARALAQRPKVMILDEATSSLDLRFQARIFKLLGQLNRQGMTILVVSHDLNLAAEFCPRMIWLNKGQLYSKGTVEETLTDKLMKDLYDVEGLVAVGANPFSGRPKVFWKSE